MEALDLLAAYGIPIARPVFATNADDAVRVASTMGFPVVMKLVSADVVHKSDVGGVSVGLESADDVRTAYDEMMSRVRAALPRADVDGVLLQPMVRGGTEVIVGMARDSSFGPLVMFGVGGVFVEAMHDVVFRIAPLDEDEAMTMMASIRGARLLDGFRGAPPVDRSAIAQIIRRVGQLAVDHPEIAELDINPVLARVDDAIALDARVHLVGARPA
jgi:acyl-CoA synthetase (NDP forming)